MAKPQRDDAEDFEDDEGDAPDEPEETDEETDDEETPTTDETDDLASDEEVKQWILDVTDTPEIKQIIRQTAREVSKRSTDRAVAEVREALEADFAKRLEKVTKLLEEGTITESEANRRAIATAEAAVKAERRRNKLPDIEDVEDQETTPSPSSDDKKREEEQRQAAEDARREQDEREQRIKTRELQAYMREALADEDKSKIIPEMIEVRQGMTENDIDDMIEHSREVRDRLRKQIISELRKQGWKSPRDLKAAQDVDEDETEEDETAPGPPQRDAKTDTLTKSRRAELRSRFGYARDKVNR